VQNNNKLVIYCQHSILGGEGGGTSEILDFLVHYDDLFRQYEKL